MFCVTRYFCIGAEGVGFCKGFALSDSFSTVPRASAPIFMFCAPGLVFGCTEGVGSHFHFLRARTRFQQYRRRRVLFSCFALPVSFSTVPRASALVFMICAPGHVFGGAEGVGSRFNVLYPWTHFHRYRGRHVLFSCFTRPDTFLRCEGRRVPFSCFAPPDAFSAVRRASGPVFMFCALGLIFDNTEGVGSLFHILQARIL
jgi:hypothetical protein